jgi:hypothetical protein
VSSEQWSEEFKGRRVRAGKRRAFRFGHKEYILKNFLESTINTRSEKSPEAQGRTPVPPGLFMVLREPTPHERLITDHW